MNLRIQFWFKDFRWKSFFIAEVSCGDASVSLFVAGFHLCYLVFLGIDENLALNFALFYDLRRCFGIVYALVKGGI